MKLYKYKDENYFLKQNLLVVGVVLFMILITVWTFSDKKDSNIKDIKGLKVYSLSDKEISIKVTEYSKDSYAVNLIYDNSYKDIDLRNHMTLAKFNTAVTGITSKQLEGIINNNLKENGKVKLSEHLMVCFVKNKKCLILEYTGIKSDIINLYFDLDKLHVKL